MQDERREQTEGHAEDPCADQVDHHHIVCFAAASDDPAAEDHILYFEGRDERVCGQDLPGELPDRIFDRVDPDIIGSRRDDDQGEHGRTDESVQDQQFRGGIGFFIFFVPEPLSDDDACRLG